MQGSAITWRRHPADVSRLVFSALLLGLAILFATWQPDALTSVSGDLVRLLARLPLLLRVLVVGVAQVAVVLLPLGAVAWAFAQRALRPAAMAALAALASAAVMAALVDWVERIAPLRTGRPPADGAWLFGSGFPSVAYVSALGAAVTVVAPLLNRPWRRTAWAAVFLAALLRLLSAAVVPVTIVVAVLVGITVASAVLVVAGAPVRPADLAGLRRALRQTGLEVDDLEPVPGATRPTFTGRGTDGDAVRVAWMGRDERDADLLARTWRALRVKGLDDEVVVGGPRRQMRQEAVVLLLAAASGVSVPEVLAVGDTDDGGALLAVGAAATTRLSDLEDRALTDDLLEAIWREVQHLHDRRIAHRRLTDGHVFLEDTGAPVLGGLRGARLGAGDALLAVDVADLLTALAARVGSERAVASAARVLPVARLDAAAAMVQPLALDPKNRRLARQDRELLPDLRRVLQETTGREEVPLFPLERLGWTQVLSFVGFVFLAGIGVSFVANWSAIAEALREVDWSRLPTLIVLALLTYVAGALSLMGSVLRSLPLPRTTLVMFAQSFLNRFTPMNAGGMAMRVRYLQKGGTDLTMAATSVGLTSMASGVVQGVLIGLFALWAGSTPGSGTEQGGGEVVGTVVFVVIAVAAVVVLVPSARTLVGRWLRPLRERIVDGARDLLGRPDRLLQLFGGAALAKIATILAFVVSCRALDIDLGFAELGALYLLGNTVGGAVPTPGGVGGVEAALIIALTGAGVAEAPAAAAVLLFRLATFWFPVLPGYLCLRQARRLDLV